MLLMDTPDQRRPGLQRRQRRVGRRSASSPSSCGSAAARARSIVNIPYEAGVRPRLRGHAAPPARDRPDPRRPSAGSRAPAARRRSTGSSRPSAPRAGAGGAAGLMDVAVRRFLCGRRSPARSSPRRRRLRRRAGGASRCPTAGTSAVTPITGGIAIFAAFLIALQPALLRRRPSTARYVPLMLGAGRGLRARPVGRLRGRSRRGRKLLGQVAIALAAALAGVRPDWLPVWLRHPGGRAGAGRRA